MKNFVIIVEKENSDQIRHSQLKLNNWVWEFIGDRELLVTDIKNSKDGDFPKYYRIDFNEESIRITPSLLSIYPIYYYEDTQRILVASRISLLQEILPNKLTINKKFLLEKNLFNYSFSESTIYNEIKLVPSNASVEISDRIELKKILTIEDHFVENPNEWNNNLDDLVDLFIGVNKNSIKDGDFISFTGGFDGRSLVALGKYFGKGFGTYSFGNESNDDLTLPRSQAKRLGIPFTPVNLDENYLKDFWEMGSKLVCDHSLNTNLAQVHWYYAAKSLSRNTGTVVTGIFGSELFRTFHLPGQFISRHIISMINSTDIKKWACELKATHELKFLNIEEFKSELEEVIDRVNDYKIQNSHLPKNLLLYKFGYEESFRKFFGNQFISPMNDFVTVKAPYLNWNFITELLKSKFSGVNNDFMTDNPIKRLKGQLFYAKLIERTFPKLLDYPTNKGYAPGDLLSIDGRMRIAISFFRKRLKRRMFGVDLDNLSIISAIEENRNKFNFLEVSELYNSSFVNDIGQSSLIEKNEVLRNKYLEVMSHLIFLSNFKA